MNTPINSFNVHDSLKNLNEEEIRNYYTKNSCSAAVGAMHIQGDFNLGNVIRSANFFGFKEAFYVGGKKSFDRRSTVGTHHYIPVNFIKTEEEFLTQIDGKYTLVCVENNIPDEFKWKQLSIFDPNAFGEVIHDPLFLFGEEQLGISNKLLNASGYILTIPSFGTVRSMNVGSCAAIVMAMYRHKLGM